MYILLIPYFAELFYSWDQQFFPQNEVHKSNEKLDVEKELQDFLRMKPFPLLPPPGKNPGSVAMAGIS
jgi:hypothetical protein